MADSREVMTTERETIFALIAAEDDENRAPLDNYAASADAILAAGFRRATIEDDERECERCGVEVQYLSSEGLCDGCVAETSEDAERGLSAWPTADEVIAAFPHARDRIAVSRLIASLRMPIEDAEPVAYEVRSKRSGALVDLSPAAGLIATDSLDYDLIPLYRAPHPVKPIEVSDAMVEAALEEFNGCTTAESDGWTDENMLTMRSAIEAALKEMER